MSEKRLLKTAAGWAASLPRVMHFGVKFQAQSVAKSTALAGAQFCGGLAHADVSRAKLTLTCKTYVTAAKGEDGLKSTSWRLTSRNDPDASSVESFAALRFASFKRALSEFNMLFNNQRQAPIQHVGKSDRASGWITRAAFDPAGVPDAIRHPFPYAALFGVFAK